MSFNDKWSFISGLSVFLRLHNIAARSEVVRLHNEYERQINTLQNFTTQQ